MLYNKNAEFREKIDEVREELIDLAESKLYQLIEKGNLQAITFFLTNKGIHRGWKYRHTLDANITEMPKVIFVEQVKENGKKDKEHEEWK